MHNHRPHPHVVIPYDPRRPNAEVYSSYAPELGSTASNGLLNPWDVATPTARQPTTRQGIHPPRTRSRTRSALEPVPPTLDLQVPETQIFRSSSQRQPTAHEYYHRSSRSDSEHPFVEAEYSSSSSDSGLTSPYSHSFNLPADEVGFPFARVATSALILVVDGLQAQPVDSRVVQYDVCDLALSRRLSLRLLYSLQSEEGLLRFQQGDLAEKDEEWHHLVPSEAREALGKREVERQSVLFEAFKSERDYVADLKLIKEVV